MKDTFHLLDEPLLSFGYGQEADDPRDGLSLFGPSEPSESLCSNVVVGTPEGIALWHGWVAALNAPASCVEVSRQRGWPSYPGFEVAFGSRWRLPVKEFVLDGSLLQVAATRADRHERSYAVTNLYLEALSGRSKLDARPGLVICVVPDDVYLNCRPNSNIREPSDARKTKAEWKTLGRLRAEEAVGQDDLFGGDPSLDKLKENLPAYGLATDFRRQLKARMMAEELPVQIVREATLRITEQVRQGQKGTNPLADRLWNFATALYYKCGHKPWKTPWAREGVCYIGLAFKKADSSAPSAVCAAQMFLDSGDGIVFVGDAKPWYSEKTKEFHLSPADAEKLLHGALQTYEKLDGRPLREIFLHARSGVDANEFEGFRKACPAGAKLVSIRVRQDRSGLRLYRYDHHPIGAQRGRHAVLRGTFWQRTQRHGLLFTAGFKPRIATYDGSEVPVPLAITIQHGEADLVQVAKDILGLTKLNYNSGRSGESQPITLKYSEKVGEILLANPNLPREKWQPNFRYYI